MVAGKACCCLWTMTSIYPKQANYRSDQSQVASLLDQSFIDERVEIGG